MSGFEYHIRCPKCGLTSQVFSLARKPWEESEILLPAVNQVTKDFEVAKVPIDDESRNLHLDQLAQAHSDDTRRVSSPAIDGERIGLSPALPCPRCGAVISEAIWGGPQPTEHEFRSPEYVVGETRDLPPGADYKFASQDGSYWVECRSDSEDGLRLNRWDLYRVHERDVDLRGIGDGLISTLTAIGSRCSDLKVRERKGSFTEWPQPSNAE